MICLLLLLYVPYGGRYMVEESSLVESNAVHTSSVIRERQVRTVVGREREG